MILRIHRSLLGIRGRAFFQFVVVGLAALWCSGQLLAAEQHAPDFRVHEWGTFTAIAGADGQAVAWVPFRGPIDLPDFVEHLTNASPKSFLRGTIRMETPVMYFYSARDLTASVQAAFSRGVITEWYPHATTVQPQAQLAGPDLSRLKTDGSISWNEVEISPNLRGDFLRQPKDNHYYYARETSSSPLKVDTAAGEQREKFLFYRGASAASLPLEARQDSQGKLLVKNLFEEQIPAVILFERRGERIGYRLVEGVAEETRLDAPDLSGDLNSLSGDLEAILADQGLYSDETHAMVETWRDSWSEEGTRLIYIVPRGFIDKVLPLTINPVPEQMVRVFVGRLEIVTPATIKSVETAMAAHDQDTLKKYARFLEPILDMARQHQDPSR